MKIGLSLLDLSEGPIDVVAICLSDSMVSITLVGGLLSFIHLKSRGDFAVTLETNIGSSIPVCTVFWDVTVGDLLAGLCSPFLNDSGSTISRVHSLPTRVLSML